MNDHDKEIFEQGRLSVLKDFDAMCFADGFVGFTDDEWKAIKKFFAFNKEVSGWDREEKSEEIPCIPSEHDRVYRLRQLPVGSTIKFDHPKEGTLLAEYRGVAHTKEMPGTHAYCYVPSLEKGVYVHADDRYAKSEDSYVRLIPNSDTKQEEEIDEGIDFAPAAKIMSCLVLVFLSVLLLLGVFSFRVYRAHAATSLTGEYVALINKERPKVPVYERKDLTRIAEKRAQYLCGKTFSHEGFSAALFDGTPYSYAAENLALGYPTVKARHEAWMQSPSHREIILSKNYRYVGVASACGLTVELFGGLSY